MLAERKAGPMVRGMRYLVTLLSGPELQEDSRNKECGHTREKR